jgi:hypothetical protein
MQKPVPDKMTSREYLHAMFEQVRNATSAQRKQTVAQNTLTATTRLASVVSSLVTSTSRRYDGISDAWEDNSKSLHAMLRTLDRLVPAPDAKPKTPAVERDYSKLTTNPTRQSPTARLSRSTPPRKLSMGKLALGLGAAGIGAAALLASTGKAAGATPQADAKEPSMKDLVRDTLGLPKEDAQMQQPPASAGVGNNVNEELRRLEEAIKATATDSKKDALPPSRAMSISDVEQRIKSASSDIEPYAKDAAKSIEGFGDKAQDEFTRQAQEFKDAIDEGRTKPASVSPSTPVNTGKPATGPAGATVNAKSGSTGSVSSPSTSSNYVTGTSSSGSGAAVGGASGSVSGPSSPAAIPALPTVGGGIVNPGRTYGGSGGGGTGKSGADIVPIKSSTPRGSMAKNQQEAYAAARAEGLSDKGARILVANFRGESLAKPDSVNKDYRADGTFAHYARGIVQWDPSRSEAIRKQFGKYPNEMSVAEQTKAAIWEMKNTKYTKNGEVKYTYGKAWDALNNDKLTDNERMFALVSNYERPARPELDTAKRLGFLQTLRVSDNPEQAAAIMRNDVAVKSAPSATAISGAAGRAPDMLTPGDASRLPNPARANLERVDPRLVSVNNEAARIYEAANPGFGVRMGGRASGFRANSSTGNHSAQHDGHGGAMDLQIYDKTTGKGFPNYQNGETAPMYQELHNYAKAAQTKYYPEMPIRAGMYFGGGYWGDLMHNDTLVRKGMSQGSWEKGYSPAIMQKLGMDPAKNRGMGDVQKFTSELYRPGGLANRVLPEPPRSFAITLPQNPKPISPVVAAITGQPVNPTVSDKVQYTQPTVAAPASKPVESVPPSPAPQVAPPVSTPAPAPVVVEKSDFPDRSKEDLNIKDETK